MRDCQDEEGLERHMAEMGSEAKISAEFEIGNDKSGGKNHLVIK